MALSEVRELLGGTSSCSMNTWSRLVRMVLVAASSAGITLVSPDLSMVCGLAQSASSRAALEMDCSQLHLRPTELASGPWAQEYVF